MTTRSKLLAVLLLLLATSGGAEESDRLFRFTYIGCNRVGFEVNPAENPSTANLEQLRNTFREVAATEPKPTHLFFLGDLILGYTGYLSTVDQLEAWRSEYRRSPLYGSGVTLVPVVGNHEVLLSHQNPQTKKWHDYPNPPAAKAWSEVMKPLLKWRDGPTDEAPNLDHLTLSQEEFSFTVREQNTLFILLNTDTFVDGVTTGDIPLHWLEQKLAEGQADPEIEHIFVMGHKPLVRPGIQAWIIREDEIQPALKLLNTTPKVKAFLTSHYHLWDYREMPGGVPQIIAGNGGSVLKGPFTDPEVGYYGYTHVDVMKNGDIWVESWGRPVPTPYSSREPQPPATLRERRLIEARSR